MTEKCGHMFTYGDIFEEDIFQCITMTTSMPEHLQQELTQDAATRLDVIRLCSKHEAESLHEHLPEN